MGMNKYFSSFNVGDCAVFRQSFEPEEFENFAALSGDRNPMHYDSAHTGGSKFGRTIVPMHMTIAPLSRIAGMIFPGAPSLYLGHEVRSISPVYFGDKLIYSARITAVNPKLRTLTIRVLVIRDVEVVLDAEMLVMSQQESWDVTKDAPDLSPPPKFALVTGATGEIGTALAFGLARRGWNLLLVDRGEGPKRDALIETLNPLLNDDQRVEFFGADFVRDDEMQRLCEEVARRNDVTALFHTASPSLNAAIDDLVKVNYSALQKLATAVTRAMLMRQEGVVATISSIATERVIPSLRDYSAAKAMASQLLTSFDKTYSIFGLRGLVVLSGLVATRYSASIQGNDAAMLPEELANGVLVAALDDLIGQAVIIEWDGRRDGKLGFHVEQSSGSELLSAGSHHLSRSVVTGTPNSLMKEGNEDNLDSRIAEVVRSTLKLQSNLELLGGGVGITPGWDSLRHIELVLELESVFGMRFRSDEVEKIMNYNSLLLVTRGHIAQ
jgi:short-subunit dehydrogenase/acyl dehydratase/acyl carrier protein